MEQGEGGAREPGAISALALRVHPSRNVATNEFQRLQELKQPSLAAEPTRELLRQTVEETKELVRLELKLAREELREDVRKLKLAAILGSIAIVLGLLVLSTLGVALVLALGGTVMSALGVAALLFVLAGTMALIAYKNVPGVPLERTRARLESDINQFREHVT